VNLTIIPLLNALPPEGVNVFLPIISLSIAIDVALVVGAISIAVGPVGLQKYSW